MWIDYLQHVSPRIVFRFKFKGKKRNFDVWKVKLDRKSELAVDMDYIFCKIPVHIRTVLFFWMAATTVSIIRPAFIINILLNLLVV